MTLVQVSGQYLTEKGLPSTGRIAFIPRVIFPHTGAALPADNTSVGLQANGSFIIPLPATNELPGVIWIYSIHELINGVARFYEIDIASTYATSGFDLPSHAPVPESGGGGGGGAVSSVDGRVGAVTLSDLYQSINANLNLLGSAPIGGTGLALLGSSSAAGARTTLGLGSAATAATSAFDAAGAAAIAQATAIAASQPLDIELTALATLTSAADKLAYFTGSGTAGLVDFSAFARTLIDDVDAASMRSTLGIIAGGVTTVDGRSGAVVLSDLYQPLDSDLTAIAALTTTSFGRAFLALTDAAATRTALNLVVGTDVQAFDADLSAIAGVTSAADKLAYFTGSATAGVTDFSAFARTLIDDANATAARATLGLVIGTDVQAYDSDLLAIAALATTSYGRSFLTFADATAGRTALSLGTAAVEDVGGSTGLVKLVGGLVPTANVPPLAISDVFPVSSQAAQVALTAQRGDVAIRSDENKTYILSTDDPTIFANWKQVLTPASGVTLVDGRTGVVTLSDLYQPLDSDLTAVAALATTSFGRAFLTQTDASTTKTTLGLVIGTDVQAYDADLLAIAALTTTSYGRGILTLADLTAFYTMLAVDTDGTLAANSDAKLVSQKAVKTYVAANAGGSNFTRTTANATTSSLAFGVQTSATSIVLAISYRVFSVTTSRQARVRLYSTAAKQTADLNRGIGIDPDPSSGLLLDYITQGTSTYYLDPLVDGVSLESSPSSTISMTVTNLDSVTGTVQVTLGYIRTE